MEEKKRDHKIYMYTNKVNGKVYIGRTCQKLYKRAKSDGSGYKKCPKFWNAIKKYGWDNFEPQILEEGLDYEEAAVREMFYVHKYHSDNKSIGYNIINEVERDYSDKTRERMREKAKGMSEETKKKIGDANRGKKRTPEFCEAVRKRQTGKKQSPEIIEKRIAPLRGKKRGPLSKEHKAKLRAAKLGKYKGKDNPNWGKHPSEESRKRMSEAQKGKKMSKESCEKISKALKGKPTWNKGKKMSEEFCKHVSEAVRSREDKGEKKIRCIETGIVYPSITNASECTGIKIGTISYALNKSPYNQACGYHWEFVDDNSEPLTEEYKKRFIEEHKPKPLVSWCKGKKMSEETRKKMKEAQNRRWQDKSKKQIKCVETGALYGSIKEASEATGIKTSNLWNGLNKSPTHFSGGYHWEFVEEP